MRLEDRTPKPSGGDNETSKYPKFKKIGDTVVGKFASFTESVRGKFGLEDQLILTTDHGDVMVGCTSHLARVIKSNLDELDERCTLTIKYVSDKDIGKASPMKVFEIDVEKDPF
ncbi:MAG TPA: hypothetical protein VN894_01750 [Polyangiaceae bacterium]|nr:hypothetical protein [Polyangiaceae bacterium]